MAEHEPPEVLAEAARRHEGLLAHPDDLRLRAELDTWLAADRAHADAFVAVEESWAVAQRAATTPAMLAIRHGTLARLLPARTESRWPAFVKAAGLIATIGGVFWLTRPAAVPVQVSDRRVVTRPVVYPTQLYRTGVGERMTLALADGSSAILNTASRLRIAYTPAERRIVLESGEAFFTVAKGQVRPFVVAARDRTVTAHGTRFDVRADRSRLDVALIEGKVSVKKPASPADAEVQLRPSQLLVANGDQTSVHHVADIARFVGWREGFIYLHDSSLAEAAAEMNRYVDRPRIEVEPAVARLKLSGAFRTGQSEALISLLEQGFPVRVVKRDANRILLGPVHSEAPLE